MRTLSEHLKGIGSLAVSVALLCMVFWVFAPLNYIFPDRLTGGYIGILVAFSVAIPIFTLCWFRFVYGPFRDYQPCQASLIQVYYRRLRIYTWANAVVTLTISIWLSCLLGERLPGPTPWWPFVRGALCVFTPLISGFLGARSLRFLVTSLPSQFAADQIRSA